MRVGEYITLRTVQAYLPCVYPFNSGQAALSGVGDYEDTILRKSRFAGGRDKGYPKHPRPIIVIAIVVAIIVTVIIAIIAIIVTIVIVLIRNGSPRW